MNGESFLSRFHSAGDAASSSEEPPVHADEPVTTAARADAVAMVAESPAAQHGEAAREQEQFDQWWLGPASDLPPDFPSAEFRAAAWEDAPESVKAEWAAACERIPKMAERFTSPLELRWDLVNLKRQDGQVRNKLGELRRKCEAAERKLARLKLEVIRDGVHGPEAAALADHLLARMAANSNGHHEEDA